MKTTQRLKIFVRMTAMASTVTLAAMAPADLRLFVSVSLCGNSIAGIPTQSQYEVDFQEGHARLVMPDVTFMIFNFSSGQVTTVDPKAKTQTSQSIQAVLADKVKATTTMSRDPKVTSKTLFGAEAFRALINAKGVPLLRDTPHAIGTETLGGHSLGLALAVTGTSWLADGTCVKTSVGSIAPLVMIGVPHSMVVEVTKSLNAACLIPLGFSLSWNAASKAPSSLDMTVTQIEVVDLEASIFQIPADYKTIVK